MDCATVPVRRRPVAHGRGSPNAEARAWGRTTQRTIEYLRANEVTAHWSRRAAEGKGVAYSRQLLLPPAGRARVRAGRRCGQLQGLRDRPRHDRRLSVREAARDRDRRRQRARVRALLARGRRRVRCRCTSTPCAWVRSASTTRSRDLLFEHAARVTSLPIACRWCRAPDSRVEIVPPERCYGLADASSAARPVRRGQAVLADGQANGRVPARVSSGASS